MWTNKAIAQNAQAFWRQNNITYLQYLSLSSRLLRACLKEPLRSKALAREPMFFNKSVPGGAKVPVTSVVGKRA